MAKSMKTGGGGKFAMVKDAIQSKGMSADSAAAIAAAAGRKKYGNAQFQKMAEKGRKRAKK